MRWRVDRMVWCGLRGRWLRDHDASVGDGGHVTCHVHWHTRTLTAETTTRLGTGPAAAGWARRAAAAHHRPGARRVRGAGRKGRQGAAAGAGRASEHAVGCAARARWAASVWAHCAASPGRGPGHVRAAAQPGAVLLVSAWVSAGGD
eukprot:783276-Rhodomonas_salina.6